MKYQLPYKPNPRTIEIEKTFEKHREEIRADLEAVDLTFREIAKKYKVNDSNVTRWSERLGIDSAERQARRREAKKIKA